MDRMTTAEMASILGFIGNVDEALTLDWVKTQLVDPAEQGDSTAIFRLAQIARHSDNVAAAKYASEQLERLETVETKEEDKEGKGD